MSAKSPPSAASKDAASVNQLKSIGEEAWKKSEKINAELFAFTYGAFVSQLVRDSPDYETVTRTLDRIGWSMGSRMVDQFLAAVAPLGLTCSGGGRREWSTIAQVIARVAFRHFLNLAPTITGWSNDGRAFSLVIDEPQQQLPPPAPAGSPSSVNPFTVFVELPAEAVQNRSLRYSALLAGIIRGALEMLGLIVETEAVKCSLLGDEATEIRVQLVRLLEDDLPLADM